MKSKPKISVAIATFNEESNIARCLDSVTGWVNEIIVADENSTDSTVKLVNKYPNTRVIITHHEPVFHITKQKAIDAATGTWILQLDADEVVTPKLKTEILKTVSSPTALDGYWINRQNYFLGTFLKKGGIYPDPTIRFYKKGKGHLPCKDVHEQAEINGQVGHLNSDLLHFSDPNFSRYLVRQDRYTSLLASDLDKANVSIDFLSGLNYFILKPIHWFLLSYVLHRGYVDGFPGFVFSLFSSLRFPIAYIKLWEKRHVKTI